MELNIKCCDDAISGFVMEEFARHSNVFIRQPQFLELDLTSLEAFLSLPNINAHEWELLHAIRQGATENVEFQKIFIYLKMFLKATHLPEIL